MTSPKASLYALLRWSERYTKTDMVYLATSGFWLNLNVLIISVLSLALSVAFANLLPAEVYGTYQYLLSFSTIVGACMLTGMNYAVTTAVAKGKEGAFRAAVSLQLRWSVVPFLVSTAIAGYYYLQGNLLLAAGLLVIGICIPLISTFTTYSAYLNGKKQFKQGFIYASIVNLSYYVAIFLAVLYLKEALWLLVINLGVNAIVLFLIYIHILRTNPPNGSTDLDALTYGKHLSAMNAFTIGVRQTDALLVFHILGPATLALYTFATIVPERVAGLFKFLFFAGLPKFAAQSRSSITRTLFPKLVQATIAGALVAGVYALFAPVIFQVLFPLYTSAIPYTQIFAIAILGSASNLTLSALTAQGLQKRLYVFNIVSPIFLLIAQVVLLLLYGLWGIIIARILAVFFDIALSGALLFWSAPEPTGVT